ncbi:permease [Cumulibacter soli]|uniref:permease n=1 Tax=Cumulibacter soli TaxID=2546344 RepID=UPI001068703E|nr:permease [Cumulibacter soli]
MATEQSTVTDPGGASRTRTAQRPLSPSTLLLIAALVLIALLRPVLGSSLLGEGISAWSTIFTAMFVQATPFLVLGVAISAAVAAFVPESFFQKALPKRPALAVPAAGAAGVALPGCECGSVPIAKGLFNKGVPLSAALAFMLSAPAINPVVLVATAVAFPGTPEMVLGRFTASLMLAVVMGYLWAWLGRADWVRRPSRTIAVHGNKWQTFVGTATHDFLHTGGYLVLGAAAAATLQVVVPASIMNSVASSFWLSVLVLAVLAVVLSICSEADAFVAAALVQFPLTARLAFLVVGPAVDLKLIALQSSAFGRGFALRFASTTFVLAIACAVLVGWWLL